MSTRNRRTSPAMVEAWTMPVLFNYLLQQKHLGVRWYSWVGSNHRPPVPQEEYSLRRGYAIPADATKMIVLSMISPAAFRLICAAIGAIVVATW
jgi:hypothetical protein